jgi:hypothetical protein
MEAGWVTNIAYVYILYYLVNNGFELNSRQAKGIRKCGLKLSLRVYTVSM